MRQKQCHTSQNPIGQDYYTIYCKTRGGSGGRSHVPFLIALRDRGFALQESTAGRPQERDGEDAVPLVHLASGPCLANVTTD